MRPLLHKDFKPADQKGTQRMTADPPEGTPEISAEFSPGCRVVVTDLLNGGLWGYEITEGATTVTWWPELGEIDVEAAGDELPTLGADEVEALGLWPHVAQSDHQSVFITLRSVARQAEASRGGDESGRAP